MRETDQPPVPCGCVGQTAGFAVVFVRSGVIARRSESELVLSLQRVVSASRRAQGGTMPSQQRSTQCAGSKRF
jgi:hypothetical protein